VRENFEILAGDFTKGSASITDKEICMFSKPAGFATVRYSDVRLPVRRIRQVEVATEESVKRVGGAVGWGAAGAILAGPAGLIAGALLGGRGKDVTFVVVFDDGRKFLAKGSSKAYEAFLKSSFGTR
jgi:hypothetical protein